jgi:polyhydroxybutyrate depolymerase
MHSWRSRSNLRFLWFLGLLLSLACGRIGTAPAPPPMDTIPAATPAPSETEIAPVNTRTPGQFLLSSGDHTRTLVSGGMERQYILHIPPGYDPSQPTPLVLAYHGIDLNAQEMMRISGFSAQADEENFLVAYPQGSGSRQSWNGGTCCGEAMLKRVDDVGFTRAMIEDIAQQANVDHSRVFATGFSNGAIMVYRLACDLADQIAAIGPVAAAPATTSCNPSRPVSVIHFHGDADHLNPYEGGERSGGRKFMPVEEGIDLWAGLDDCPAQAQETQEGNLIHRVYAPCQQDSAVELYKIVGGEHAWPGGEAVSEQVGVPTEEIDATSLMWAFFEGHPRP